MKCEYCGRIIKPGETICPGCGAEVIEQSEPKRSSINIDKEPEQRQEHTERQYAEHTYVPPVHHCRRGLYAGFGLRFAAFCIDAIIVSILAGIVGIVNFSGFLMGILVGAYFIGFEVKNNGQTPGKRAVGIRVISLDGENVSVGQSVVRYIGKGVSAMFLIGYLMPLITPKKRALHDYMAHTVVIKG